MFLVEFLQLSPMLDELFTESNIRSYFGKYGKIVDAKMLDEDKTGGICFITFEDFDSSDRILLDAPHHLNGQLLSIHKYTSPEAVTNLSQYRFVDPNNAHRIHRWYPILRNFTDLVRPLEILYKTQLALLRYNTKKQIALGSDQLNQVKEELLELENKYNNFKQNFLQLCQVNEQLKQQIDDNERKTEVQKNEYERQIEEQRRKNRALEEAIQKLEEQS